MRQPWHGSRSRRGHLNGMNGAVGTDRQRAYFQHWACAAEQLQLTLHYLI